MIGTVLRISWLNLKRDRLALVLTFVLPLLFFSIFATVFGAMDRESINAVDAILVTEDDHEFSVRLIETLRADPLLRPVELGSDPDPARMARELVGSGDATVAVVLPAGLGESLKRRDDAIAVQLLVDRSHPVAARLVTGLVQQAALRVGYDMIDSMQSVDVQTEDAATPDPLPFEVVDVIGASGKRPSTAFFAAGIGVLFLLFAVSGRSAILVEERERGVLKRMLASRMRLYHLLLGRWLFLGMLGAAQVSLMFVWGSLAFGLELWEPKLLTGFVVMTTATAGAAAGFGLLLGSTCRTRAQLNGIAAVIILVMSALGGSMFPSFLMPESLRTLGLATFNAWALRGYQKVFWYESSPLQLWPQVAMLSAMCLAFVVAAHLVARRWRVA